MVGKLAEQLSSTVGSCYRAFFWCLGIPSSVQEEQPGWTFQCSSVSGVATSTPTERQKEKLRWKVQEGAHSGFLGTPSKSSCAAQGRKAAHKAPSIAKKAGSRVQGVRVSALRGRADKAGT